MTEDIEQWHQIAALLHEALPAIDNVLSEANVSISDRKLKAFEIVRETMLEVSDERAFLASEARGRILVIIAEWYRDRYGAAIEMDDDDQVVAVAMVHNTPFVLRVPKIFKIPPDEEGLIWLGFPASVQKEEDPLVWFENQAVVKSLSSEDQETLRQTVTITANFVRSIGFDLRALTYDTDVDISDLAGAIGTDLQAGARHLCQQSQAGLRASGWEVSQATEKSLKVLIRRKGEVPPHTHDLTKLADRAEALGSASIDRAKLALIPSKSDATNMRYGGSLTLGTAVATYFAGLEVIKGLLLEATPETKYNVRELRIQLQRPPWLGFDVDGFIATMRSRGDAGD
jgi:hypothetical protein